jgi:ribosomal protein L7Ae-like RNA K-turn-binding protein
LVQKAYDLIGLAQRAGCLRSGDAAVEAIIKKGKAKLLILAIDASERTKQHFINLADYKKIQWIEGGQKNHFGIALGRSPRSVVIVTDVGFARKLTELFGGVEEDF